MSLEKIKRLRCLIWRLYTRKKVYVESRVIEYLCAYLDDQFEDIDRVCSGKRGETAAGLVPAGEFVKVRITGVSDGDLTGEIED